MFVVCVSRTIFGNRKGAHVQIEEEKHGNEEVRLNMVCTQLRLSKGCYGAQVHVQLSFKVWSCFPRCLNNGSCCFKCLIGCNFRSD